MSRKIESDLHTVQIDMSDFSHGIYFLMLIDAEKKIVVNRSRVIKLR